ncbi:hypothetical protein [Cellulophaga baltica]|uniref:hypothetical protein n=1 Tax=Cellulophaga baltica TaxID=76594 RepID=UPI0024956FE1|nr:hypothetical protein [Cellulophaga baltica]
MQEIVTLHCRIDNCNTHYEYKFNEENILAICSQWRNEESEGGDWAGLLPKSPIIGEKYELLINTALKIDLNDFFWATYFEPYTEHEGLETEIGIKSMLMCLCRKKNVIEISKHYAKIEVEVINTKEINSNNNNEQETNTRTEFLNTEIDSQYVSIENFMSYSMIKANYQSDCGWTYIIEKKNDKSRIIAENHWDFHRDTWQLTNEKLNKEQEIKYGILHGV